MKILFLYTIIIFLFIERIYSGEDFYKILEVNKNAELKEIKSSYRKLSAKYHPDKNPGNKEAQEKFIKINKAYETLTDPEKKKIYDIYGEEGLEKEGQLSERGKPRGQNSNVELEVDLEDFYNSSTKKINIQKNAVCKQCHGTGGKLGETHQCPKCKGRGQVIEDVDTGMGFSLKMQNQCSKCKGRGIVFKETCPHCKGKRVILENKEFVIEVEKGMKNMEKIVFPRESEQHPDLVPGDLVVTLKQRPHHFFIDRKENDLYATINLNLKEALLGYKKSFRHLDNRLIEVTSNKPVQPFEVRVLDNEGMPHHNYSSNKGKLYLKQNVRLPSRLTEEEKKLIESFL